MSARYRLVWNIAAPYTTTCDRALSELCTATTAVAATPSSTRPDTASQARVAQVARRKAPPSTEVARAIRSSRGAIARVRRSMRSDRERYQNIR